MGGKLIDETLRRQIQQAINREVPSKPVEIDIATVTVCLGDKTETVLWPMNESNEKGSDGGQNGGCH